MRWDHPIPAIIHQIWLTEETPNELLAACRQSYLDKHPKWTNVLHKSPDAVFDDPDLSDIRLDLISFFDRCDGLAKTGTGPYRDAPWSSKADALRLAALYVFGGFYVDYDMFCIRPLDRFRADDLVLVNNFDDPPSVTEIVIGAHARDPRIKAILAEFLKCQAKGGVVTPRLTCWARQLSLFSYPTEYFCPRRRHARDVYRVTPNTHGIHCFRQNTYDVERLRKLCPSES